MNHYTTPDFWQFYNALPKEVRDLADKNYALLKADPSHSSLRFKSIEGLWSVRVGSHYRDSGVTPGRWFLLVLDRPPRRVRQVFAIENCKGFSVIISQGRKQTRRISVYPAVAAEEVAA